MAIIYLYDIFLSLSFIIIIILFCFKIGLPMIRSMHIHIHIRRSSTDIIHEKIIFISVKIHGLLGLAKMLTLHWLRQDRTSRKTLAEPGPVKV
jgi:hypothetical protein